MGASEMQSGGHGRRGTVARASVAIALSACVGAVPASADTFKPTRLDDPPPNGCKPNNCSLREALGAANEEADEDKVVLAAGTYDLEIPADESEDAGDLAIFSPVELRGKGAGETTIDANGIDRVLSIGCGVVAEGAVSVKALTMKGGDPGANLGNCVLQAQSVGGAILMFGETLTLKGVVIKRNEAVRGGGIATFAPTSVETQQLTIRDSTVQRNVAGTGGGVYLSASVNPSSTEIRSSTIFGNTASIGGGLALDGANFIVSADDEPVLDAVNSTIVGNLVSVSGGGVSANNNSTVTLDNATVAFNHADSDDSGGGDGGGVRQATGAVFNLGDSVIARNSVGSSGSGPQCVGDFGDAAGAVLQTQSTVCTLGSGSTSAPDTGLDGSLLNHGGPTRTIKLLGGSLAIGFTDDCPATDQRGEPRPATDCDSGAYERPGG